MLSLESIDMSLIQVALDDAVETHEPLAFVASVTKLELPPSVNIILGLSLVHITRLTSVALPFASSRFVTVVHVPASSAVRVLYWSWLFVVEPEFFWAHAACHAFVESTERSTVEPTFRPEVFSVETDCTVFQALPSYSRKFTLVQFGYVECVPEKSIPISQLLSTAMLLPSQPVTTLVMLLSDTGVPTTDHVTHPSVDLSTTNDVFDMLAQ